MGTSCIHQCSCREKNNARIHKLTPPFCLQCSFAAAAIHRENQGPQNFCCATLHLQYPVTPNFSISFQSGSTCNHATTTHFAHLLTTPGVLAPLVDHIHHVSLPMTGAKHCLQERHNTTASQIIRYRAHDNPSSSSTITRAAPAPASVGSYGARVESFMQKKTRDMGRKFLHDEHSYTLRVQSIKLALRNVQQFS